MAWLIGIDEAGYGPNLGPFVMTAVACQVRAPGDLWRALAPAVRRGSDGKDDRLLVDDSKVVYGNGRGLAGLERGLLATLWQHAAAGTGLDSLVAWACPDDHAELRAEPWYRGTTAVPRHAETEALAGPAARFEEACTGAGVMRWLARSVVICPARFNTLVEAEGSKGAVLADGLKRLLRHQHAGLPGDDALTVLVDKHGGRNTYAAFIQHALPDGVVLTRQECSTRSHYEVVGLNRPVTMTFQPRADTEHFCVALASMASKYLRELLMLEFNGFWQERVPGLAPTAGYPGDAPRFLDAIRPAAQALGIAESALWRLK